jgi:RNA polymerase sigma-70 factor, ECF subfamily
MNQVQERQVVQGLQDGNADAWRALYDAYCRQVWQAVARMMGPNAPDVADVVQETFMAAARSARQYDSGRGPLWLWLYGIARNNVALHFRKNKQLDRLAAQEERHIDGNRQFIGWLEGREPAPADVLQSAELAAMVRGVLTELPIDYETVLTAKYMDGASVEQIAGTQQCSAAAVRSRLARARQAFRHVFLETFNGPDTGKSGGRYES